MASAEDSFLYFAYGSNLSKARIHVNNPSAEFYNIAKIHDYKLVFGKQQHWKSERWHGGVASIQQSPGDYVLGVTWKMDKQDMPNLDRQEGVHYKCYEPIQVTVTSLTDGKKYTCRTYQMIGLQPVLPSPQYKLVIVTGASELGLPQDYINCLNALEDNGYAGHVEMLETIGLKKT